MLAAGIPPMAVGTHRPPAQSVNRPADWGQSAPPSPPVCVLQEPGSATPATTSPHFPAVQPLSIMSVLPVTMADSSAAR